MASSSLPPPLVRTVRWSAFDPRNHLHQRPWRPDIIAVDKRSLDDRLFLPVVVDSGIQGQAQNARLAWLELLKPAGVLAVHLELRALLAGHLQGGDGAVSGGHDSLDAEGRPPVVPQGEGGLHLPAALPDRAEVHARWSDDEPR